MRDNILKGLWQCDICKDDLVAALETLGWYWDQVELTPSLDRALIYRPMGRAFDIYTLSTRSTFLAGYIEKSVLTESHNDRVRAVCFSMKQMTDELLGKRQADLGGGAVENKPYFELCVYWSNPRAPSFGSKFFRVKHNRFSRGFIIGLETSQGTRSWTFHSEPCPLSIHYQDRRQI